MERESGRARGRLCSSPQNVSRLLAQWRLECERGNFFGCLLISTVGEETVNSLHFNTNSKLCAPSNNSTSSFGSELSLFAAIQPSADLGSKSSQETRGFCMPIIFLTMRRQRHISTARFSALAQRSSICKSALFWK